MPTTAPSPGASGRRQQCTGTPPIQSTPCGLSPKSGQLPLRIAPCTVSPKEIAAHMTCSHFVRILELLHCCMPASMRALHLKHSLSPRRLPCALACRSAPRVVPPMLPACVPVPQAVPVCEPPQVPCYAPVPPASPPGVQKPLRVKMPHGRGRAPHHDGHIGKD